MKSAVLLLFAVAQDPVDPIRWKLATGDVLLYRHTIEQSFHVGSNASKFDYTQKIEATERLEVESTTADGNFTVRHSISRLLVTVDGALAFDSDKPESGDAAAAAQFRNAMGGPQTFVMSPSGGTPGSTSGRTLSRFQKSFSNQNSEGEEAIPMVLVMLPEIPAEREWTVEAEEESDGGIRLQTRTTYARQPAVSGSQPIRGSTTMMLKNAPAAMKLKEGSGTQLALFDLAAGMLRESETDFSVAMEQEIEGENLRVENSLRAVTKLEERTRK